MPTYVYECSACSEVFEIEQRITEDPLKDCRCGSSGTVKRLIQPVGIAFKGAGFYVNDYSSSSASGSNASTSAPAKPDCTGEPSSCACSSAAPAEG